MIEIVPARVEHAAVLGENLREGDLREAEAWGVTGQEAVENSIKSAAFSYVFLEDDVPIAGWGIQPYGFMSNAATMWCLTSWRAEAYPKLILKLARDFVAEMHTLYPRLEILVDLRYDKALRWAHRLGFKDVDVAMVNGYPFQGMIKERA